MPVCAGACLKNQNYTNLHLKYIIKQAQIQKTNSFTVRFKLQNIIIFQIIIILQIIVTILGKSYNYPDFSSTL